MYAVLIKLKKKSIRSKDLDSIDDAVEYAQDAVEDLDCPIACIDFIRDGSSVLTCLDSGRIESWSIAESDKDFDALNQFAESYSC